MRKSVVVFMVLSAGFAAYGDQVTPLNIAAPPVLDGKLDESFWSQAPVISDFHVFQGVGEMARDTEARIVSDGAWLYMGFICSNECLSMLTPKGHGRFENAHTDESVEIFIDPGNAGAKYLQYKLSYAGAKGENRCINRQGDRAWDEPWRAVVDMPDEKSWSAEVAIPLYVLLSESGPAPWTFNICRNKRTVELDQYGVVLREWSEHSSMAKLKRGFHEPETFVPLAQPDMVEAPLPLLAVLRDVKIHPYRLKDGVKMFDVWVAMRGVNAQTGELRVEVITRPVSGDSTRTVHSFTQTGTRLYEVAISVPVDNFVDRDVEVALFNQELSGAVDRMVVVSPGELSVMKTYLGRNYYTTEPDAIVAVSLGMPPEVLKVVRLVVFSGNRELAVLKDCAWENLVSFPAAALPVGISPIRIELQQQDGTVLFSNDINLLKRDPRPGCEWKIDHINQTLLNNGEPFFPVGMVTIRARNKTQWAETLKLYKGMGFNTILINNGLLAPELLKEYCEMAAAEKMFLIIMPQSGLPRFGQIPGAVEAITQYLKEGGIVLMEESLRKLAHAPSLTRVKFWLLGNSSLNVMQRLQSLKIAYRHAYPLMLATVNAIKDSPGLIAYYTADEPTSAIPQYEVMREEYERIYAADGYRPVMPIFAAHIHPGDEWLDAADIVCVDSYWTPEADPALYTLASPNHLAASTIEMVKRCGKNRKVPWLMPCAESWSDIQRGKRTYTPAEHYCQAMLGLIHGAKGIIWFADPCHESNLAALRNVAAMVTRLAPMAAAAAVNQKIKYFLKTADESSGEQEVYLQPEKKEFPDVQGRILRDPATGELVLLAANSRYYPVDAAFAVSGLKNARVELLFKNVELEVNAGLFHESLEPFAVRAYRLGVIQEPVTAAITSVRPAAIPPPAVMLEGNVRMAGKNIMPNPSFEEATVPGVPDYYHGGGQLVATDAKFGRYCLKLPPYNTPNLPQLTFIRAPFEAQDARYTISLFIKGEKGGEEVEMRTFNSKFKQTFNVTADWARYAFPVTIPARIMSKSSLDAFWIIRNQSHGTNGADAGAVFIDGLQLERGANATEFEE